MSQPIIYTAISGNPVNNGSLSINYGKKNISSIKNIINTVANSGLINDKYTTRFDNKILYNVLSGGPIVNNSPSPTNTNTVVYQTPTSSVTPTKTPTTTPSTTQTQTPTNSTTPSITQTLTPSITQTATATRTPTPTTTSTPGTTQTPTSTLVPTQTPTQTNTPTPSQQPVTILTNSANYNNCAGNVSTVGTNGRSSYYGTYDMSGNIWEWTDTTIASLNKVIRGGNLAYNEAYLSSVYQTYTDMNSRSGFTGFRIGSYSLSAIYPNMVVVEDTNNLPNTNGFGTVSYTYYVGKYEITNDEYVEFLNAVAQSNSYGLYVNNMTIDNLGGIIRSGSAGSYSYSTKINKNNKPVNLVSWFNCARYCNWLHNGKITGQDAYASTDNGAYDMSQSSNIARNNNASFFMLSENEWYKAAYYKGGGTNAGYWMYATQSNVAPNCVQLTPTGDGIPV